MHKKFAATLTITIFLLSTLAVLAPVQAHFTLGDLGNPATNGGFPYHYLDFDPHVEGVIGYVWPGSGLNAYGSFLTPFAPYAGNVMTNNLPPGYQDPFATYPVNAPPSQSWYQVAGNTYAPFGAILVNSTGDLVFAVNATIDPTALDQCDGNSLFCPPAFGLEQANGFTSEFTNVQSKYNPPSSPNLVEEVFTPGAPWKPDQTHASAGWGSFDILIPPEFGNIKPEQVVSTITNDYDAISVSTLSPYDRFAPGWTLVSITADINADNLVVQNYLFQSTLEWYYVRINGVTAPAIAGKYFFKMFLGGAGESGECDSPTCQPDYWVPAANWPVLLVKGEVDPAIISGQIFYGGFNPNLYNTPIEQAGEVYAKMTTKLDPYTGAKLNGPLTDAWGFFNETASGHYEVEGVAPGVYDVYAQAAGYPQQLIASGVTVLKGQSLQLNGYLNPGVVIHGNVYSKHGFGEEPWTGDLYDFYTEGEGTGFNLETNARPMPSVPIYIKIEIYNQPTVGNQVASTAGAPVSWSPLPCVLQDPIVNGGDEGQTMGWYFATSDVDTNCGPDKHLPVAFPWQDYGLSPWSDPQGLYHHGNHVDSTIDQFADPMGVSPAQEWVIPALQQGPFTYQFGDKGLYGAPSQLDGHVPQRYATWDNGLGAGRYYLRAWVAGYVQTELDGVTFHEVPIDIAANEWAGDVVAPIDLRVSSFVVKTVHFHNTPGTLKEDDLSSVQPIYLTGGLYDSNNVLWSWTAWQDDGTAIGAQYSCTGFMQFTLHICTADSDGYATSATLYFFGFYDRWDGQDYGIPTGTYTPKVFMMGYAQQTFEQVSLTLSGTPVMISDHLYRGAGFNITVYSTDFEQPRVERDWLYGYPDTINCNFDTTSCDTYSAAIDLAIYDSTGALLLAEPSWAVQVNGQTWAKGTEDTIPCDGTHPTCGVFWGEDSGDAQYEGGVISTTDEFITSASPSFSMGTHYESGQYSFRALTYGYVQKKDFSVYALKGQIADIKINLVIGVNITVNIPFKKEGLYTETPFDMASRVRVFDDSGKLVGEWMSSQGVIPHVYGDNCGPGGGELCISSYGFDEYSWTETPGIISTVHPFHDPWFNHVPFGTDSMTVTIAGLPNTYEGEFGDPVFDQGGFVVGDYASGGPLNYGIDGAPNYQGGYSVEVDYVPWYLAGFAFVLGGAGGDDLFSGFYPPPQGLLMGESFHTVPGHPQNPFGWTEVGALSTTDYMALGHSMAPNHLGPYAQEGVWSLPNAHLSGEASGEWEVDLRGYLSGGLVGFTWSGEFRTLSWATVSIVGADGFTYNQYSFDGQYQMWANPGDYKMTIAMPGYTTLTVPQTIATGQTSAASNLFLQESQIPIPEFSGLAIVAFSALAASLYLLRRRRR